MAEEVGREIAILADMQGPKIRLSSFENGSIELAADQPFILDPSIAANMGDVNAVGIDYPELYQDVHAGDTLLIGDGEMRFSVERVDGAVIHCRNRVAGVIYDHKGINRQVVVCRLALSPKKISKIFAMLLRWAPTLLPIICPIC